jgi:hypothetical protein
MEITGGAESGKTGGQLAKGVRVGRLSLQKGHRPTKTKLRAWTVHGIWFCLLMNSEEHEGEVGGSLGLRWSVAPTYQRFGEAFEFDQPGIGGSAGLWTGVPQLRQVRPTIRARGIEVGPLELSDSTIDEPAKCLTRAGRR